MNWHGGVGGELAWRGNGGVLAWRGSLNDELAWRGWRCIGLEGLEVNWHGGVGGELAWRGLEVYLNM